MSEKPIIGITMGDPASIGPEIAIKALLDPSIHAQCRPLLVGDAGVFRRIIEKLQLPARVHVVTEVAGARFVLGAPDVLDLHNVDPSQVAFGQVSAMAGDASFQAVKKVIDLALAGEIAATVTGPFTK